MGRDLDNFAIFSGGTEEVKVITQAKIDHF